MDKTLLIRCAAIAGVFAAGFLSSRLLGEPKGKVYELRTYTTHEGKLDSLNARFRDHTTRLFKKHGMTNVAYWTPVEGPTSKNTLVYVLRHDSVEAAKKSWEAFRTDPDWIKARDASEASGKINQKVESVFLEATDYSPMK